MRLGLVWDSILGVDVKEVESVSAPSHLVFGCRLVGAVLHKVTKEEYVAKVTPRHAIHSCAFHAQHLPSRP